MMMETYCRGGVTTDATIVAYCGDKLDRYRDPGRASENENSHDKIQLKQRDASERVGNEKNTNGNSNKQTTHEHKGITQV